jgi:PhnB protein
MMAAMNMKLSPQISLGFDGTCETALKFYERCLNGKIEFLLRWGESPTAKDVPPDWQDKVVHARLLVGDTTILAADVLPEHYRPKQGFSFILNVDNPKEADRLFAVLGEKGTILMPMQETFWAPRFGVVLDQFGIQWDINCEKSE